MKESVSSELCLTIKFLLRKVTSFTGINMKINPFESWINHIMPYRKNMFTCFVKNSISTSGTSLIEDLNKHGRLTLNLSYVSPSWTSEHKPHVHDHVPYIGYISTHENLRVLNV